ncbi:DUF6420 family protein [Streptomyces anulatus]|uniref:DUF6420 family protein n=1 Tax=Streptomyces anulatus TaxID=1892 RepID=UPI0036FC57F1
MSEDRGAAGPYVEYDGLPVLHGSEGKLPLIHPYAPMEAGWIVTPGGGRLTIGKAEQNAAHLRVTLDHLGCPAQCVEEKDAAFRQLALAVEGYCVHAGCRHRAAFMDGVFRHFELRDGTVSPKPAASPQSTPAFPPNPRTSPPDAHGPTREFPLNKLQFP